jgi:precorrin-4/cobalt-precorrin-4 C11-methyltransferase
MQSAVCDEEERRMTVYFIGAGPGAADLITVRGQRLLSRCPVCLYAGSIMPDDLLALCPPAARIVDTGPLTLERIIAEIADADAAGDDVARLHSGDPSLYSALAEQCRRLDALGIGYEIVPGVPAFAAAAAALGRELTVPGVAQTVTLTRVATLSTPLPPGEALTSLARSGATLVLHLAAAQIDAIVPQLLAGGYHPKTPTAVVAFASWPQQVVLRGTLADIAGQLHEAAITKTAVIIVGDVLAAEGFTDSYLYSAERARGSASHDAVRSGKPGRCHSRQVARPVSSQDD